MGATKVVHISLIGIADKFAKSSDMELGIMRLELMQMCDDLFSGEAILDSDTPSESVLALSMMLVSELGQRRNNRAF
jgi:hypothetical protein